MPAAALLVCLVAGCLAGCGTGATGRAVPRPTTGEPTTIPSTTQASGSVDASQAPQVASPLDTAEYQRNPCGALSAAQAAGLNISRNGKFGESPVGNDCQWVNSQTGADVDLRYLSQNKQGLAAAYLQKAQGQYAYFIEYPDIGGYPAVAAATSDDRPTGGCVLYIGFTDHDVFQLGVQQSLKKVGTGDPCQVTVEIAKMMVQTMKSGA